MCSPAEEMQPVREIVTRENNEADDEGDEKAEESSLQGSVTPRPRKAQHTPSRSSGRRIGSGATASFQPRQSITPLDTNLGPLGYGPSHSSQSSSGHTTASLNYFTSPVGAGKSSAKWMSPQVTGYPAESHSNHFGPQYAQGSFVQSPTQMPTRHRGYSTSGQTTPITPQWGVAKHQGVTPGPLAGPSGPRHANYPHASAYPAASEHSQGQSAYASCRTSGQATPITPQNHPGATQGLSTIRAQSYHGRSKPSHTNSRTWTSPRAKEEERWTQVEENLKHMELIPRSPFVPHDFEEFLQHRVGRLEDARAEAKRLDKIRSEHAAHPIQVAPAFGGKKFTPGRGAVLGQPTIWHEPFDETAMGRPMADWPTPDEMREEGDERNTSRFGRFLGLPRSPGNRTVNWKVKNYVQPSAMDAVWKLPTAQSYEERKEKWTSYQTDTFEDFLGTSLMEALECEPEVSKH